MQQTKAKQMSTLINLRLGKLQKSTQFKFSYPDKGKHCKDDSHLVWPDQTLQRQGLNPVT